MKINFLLLTSFLFFIFFDSRYVHNNIFFSFAVDADLDQLYKKRTSDPNFKTGSRNFTHNLSEKVSNDLLNGTGGASNGENCDASLQMELNGTQELASDNSSETQSIDSEQATYASANNDLKGTKAYQEADVPGLYNLAMAIIDYRGHRVVAQVHAWDHFSHPLRWSSPSCII